jgi:dihydroxyacetone kinase-like protein
VELRPEQYLQYIAQVAAAINGQKDYITALDAATGDGDHWLNLNIGYQKVVEASSELENAVDFKALFTGLATKLMSSMGGTSGALYGGMYLAAAKRLENIRVLDAPRLAELLGCWADDIARRGNTAPGDKTMLDTLAPAAREYAAAVESAMGEKEALDVLRQAARAGAENTGAMRAKRGRASNQPEKGVGHLDPGAVTMAIKLEQLSEFLIAHCI